MILYKSGSEIKSEIIALISFVFFIDESSIVVLKFCYIEIFAANGITSKNNIEIKITLRSVSANKSIF